MFEIKTRSCEAWSLYETEWINIEKLELEFTELEHRLLALQY